MLNFDLFHSGFCDTMGIYHNMCLQGLVTIQKSIMFTSLKTDERMDRRTNRQVDNVMPPPVSLACHRTCGL